MSDIPANGTTLYRLVQMERRLERMEAYEPAVMQEQIRNMEKEVQQMSRTVTWMLRTFIAFTITFAFTGVTLVVSIVGK